jgi:hypothetical protein
VQFFPQLIAEDGHLVDEVATLPDQKLELLVLIGPDGVDESEAIDSSAIDGGEIVVVGLVARVGNCLLV